MPQTLTVTCLLVLKVLSWGPGLGVVNVALCHAVSLTDENASGQRSDFKIEQLSRNFDLEQSVHSCRTVRTVQGVLGKSGISLAKYFSSLYYSLTHLSWAHDETPGETI